MTISLLIAAVIILLCVVLNRVSDKAGVPLLLFFILLGMTFGSDGIFRIQFDNYEFAEQICSVALIFIMFYGGFGTNWEHAKPVALQAGLLSTLGVVLTAGLVGIFCYGVLGMELLTSLLIGSVISSTDAASVFSILRSRKLGLKENTASLLELESGSNDPCSYMMTFLVLSVMEGQATVGSAALMVFKQFFFAILVSVLVTLFARYMFKRFSFSAAGSDTIFVIGLALFSYAAAGALGGNGYLSTYFVGILLGNSDIGNKKTLVPFFDGVTGLMQILVFFLLGLLAFPKVLGEVFVMSVLIGLFLTFIGRPAAVFLILAPFRCSTRQKLLVSFAGLRGAASIVFAIMAAVSPAYGQDNVFHIVFGIVLLSIAIQGTLIPWAAKRLDMIDKDANVLKTFNDYEEANVQFVELPLHNRHPWNGKTISDISLVPDMLIILIRRGVEALIPGGDTVLAEGDRVVLSAPAFQGDYAILLLEKKIGLRSKWVGRTISEYSTNPRELIILIRRGEETVIPRGDTVLEAEDVLVIHSDRIR